MYELFYAEWDLACAFEMFARMLLMCMMSDDRQGKAVDKILLNDR